MPISQLGFQAAYEKLLKNYNIAKYLLNQHIFQDHFFQKLQNSETKDTSLSPPKQFKRFHSVIVTLIDMLKTKPPKEIADFASASSWTKTDKILTVLLLISNSAPAEKIFNLIESFGLSVNDSLTAQNINTVFIPENLTDFASEKIAILSHHLAGAGDPAVIDLLLDTNYDSNIKTSFDESILHSAVRLSSMFYPPKNISKYKSALLRLAENNPHLMNERDMFGFTPLATAIEMGNKTAFEVLTDNKFSPNLKATDRLNRDLTTLAKLKTEPYFFSQLNRLGKTMPSFQNQPEPAKENTEFQLPSINWEPFIKRLFSAVSLAHPEANRAELKQSYNHIASTLKYFEDIRLSVLRSFFPPDKKSAKGQGLIFEAIANRDERFFQNLSLKEKTLLGIPFLYHLREGEMLFVTDFLLEAVRHSFLPAVRAILSHHRGDHLSMGPITSASPSPLPLSIITYASLDKEHPYKQEARDIMRLLEKQTDITKNDLFLMKFDAITWAILLGELEIVKSFNEKRGLYPISDIFYTPNSRVSIYQYLETQGFLQMRDYLTDHFDRSAEATEGPGACHQAFLN